MPRTALSSSWRAKPAIPACVEPVTEQTTTVSADAELLLLLGHFFGPASEAEAAERVVGSAGRDRVRLAAALLHRGERFLPARPDADVEPSGVETDVGAHDPGQEDVPDLVVDDVRPFDPALLDEHAVEPEPRGDRGDLARVFDWTPADRDERVAPCASASAARYSSLRTLFPP